MVRSFPVEMSTAGFLSLFEQGGGGLFVLCGHPQVNSLAQKLLIVPLSCNYDITVLDAGNRFDPYLISRLAQASGRGPREFLSKILVSRSFTCHQTHALVRKVAGLQGNTSRLILVLGCLKTFYDEDVPFAERRALLIKTLALLQGISQKGKKVLVASADPPVDVRGQLDSLLVSAADKAVRLEVHQDGTPSFNLVKETDGHFKEESCPDESFVVSSFKR